MKVVLLDRNQRIGTGALAGVGGTMFRREDLDGMTFGRLGWVSIVAENKRFLRLHKTT